MTITIDALTICGLNHTETEEVRKKLFLVLFVFVFSSPPEGHPAETVIIKMCFFLPFAPSLCVMLL